MEEEDEEESDADNSSELTTSSPQLFSSASSTSCDSFGFSSDLSSSSSGGSFSAQSYELASRQKSVSPRKVKLSETDNTSKKKHVTFSGNKETFLFEVYSSDCSAGSNCEFEILDAAEGGEVKKASGDEVKVHLRYIKPNDADSVRLVNSPDEMQSLSSLLEPAKSLISKMDAQMNGADRSLGVKVNG